MAAIPGTILAAKISPGDTSATFPTHEDIYGKGGLVSVTNFNELTSIPLDRQKVGMLVHVNSDSQYYTVSSLSYPLTSYSGFFTKSLFVSGGNSNQWNSVYTNVNSNSADYAYLNTGILTKGNFDNFEVVDNSGFLAKTLNTSDGFIGVEAYETDQITRSGYTIIGSRLGDGFLQGSGTVRIEQAGGSLTNLRLLGLKTQDHDFSFPSKSGTFALTNDLSSNLWNSVYTYTNTNSAFDQSARSWVNNNSAIEIAVSTLVQNNSASWEESAEIIPTVTNYLSTNNIVISSLNVFGNGSFNSIQASIKNFVIPHPTKKNKKLQYSSIESPYIGIQLTGEDKTVNGVCVVNLPSYISSLIHEKNVYIQLTNYKNFENLYVDSIDIKNNKFVVKCSSLFGKFKINRFFWLLTGVRKDVPELEVEV